MSSKCEHWEVLHLFTSGLWELTFFVPLDLSPLQKTLHKDVQHFMGNVAHRVTRQSGRYKLAGHSVTTLLIAENTVCIQDSFRPVMSVAPQHGVMMNIFPFNSRVRGSTSPQYVYPGVLRCSACMSDAYLRLCSCVLVCVFLMWIMPLLLITL